MENSLEKKQVTHSVMWRERQGKGDKERGGTLANVKRRDWARRRDQSSVWGKREGVSNYRRTPKEHARTMGEKEKPV